MPTALRDFYLGVCFLMCTGAAFAPYFGVQLPIFAYQTKGGKAVEMPVSVVVYALFLLVAVAALTKRLMAKPALPEAP